MTTVAELGVKIVQEGLAETKERLEGIEKQSAATANAVDQLARQSQAGFAGLSRAANQANDALHALASMAGTVVGRLINIMAGFFSIREYQRLADKWSDLSARVQNAIGPHERAADVMRELGKMAAISYSDLGITAEAFINNAQSLKELGLNTKQQLMYQESLNNALVVSGARADRAASVQHAFGAALALGALRGDQLNSVLINGDRIAKSLAKELGVTTNELRQLGAEGKITRDVMLRAMINDFQILQDEAKEMPATIEDGFMLIRNAALILVGTFDKANGFSLAFATALEQVSKAIIWLSDNLQVVNGVLAGVATVIATRMVPGLFSIWVELVRQTTLVALYGTRWLFTLGQMKMSETAAYALSRALGVLRSALMGLGIGALAVAVGWLVTQFSQLAVAVGGWGNAFAIAKAVAVEQLGLIGEAMNYLPMVWEAAWGIMEAFLSRVLANFVEFFINMTNELGRLMRAAVEGIKSVLASLVPFFAGVMNNMVVMSGQAAARIAGNFADAFAMANPVGGLGKGVQTGWAKFQAWRKGEEFVPPKSAGDKVREAIESRLPEMVDLGKIGEGAAETFWSGFDKSMEASANDPKGGQGIIDRLDAEADSALGRAKDAAGRVVTVIKDIFKPENMPATNAAGELIRGVGEAAAGAVDPVTNLGNALDGLGVAGAGVGGAGGGGGGKKGGGAGGGKSDAQKLLEDQKKSLESLADEVERYRATVGMTALEEEIWNKQKETGAFLNPQLAAQVAEMVTEMDRLRERQAAMRSMADTIESAFGSAFSTIVTGAGSAKQALASLLQSLAKMFADRAFQILWGGGGGGGGIGGFITAGLQALAGFGGGPRVSAWRPEMNANGSPFFEGGVTSINERGGEIVDLPRGSRIYPADVSKRMVDREKKDMGKLTLEILPSGEFRTEMDTRAMGAAVNVVGSYNKSKLNNATIRKTIRRPRSIG